MNQNSRVSSVYRSSRNENREVAIKFEFPYLLRWYCIISLTINQTTAISVKRQLSKIGKKNVLYPPLVQAENLILSLLHMKLGYTKQFLKKLRVDGKTFHYLKEVAFPKLSDAMVRGGSIWFLFVDSCQFISFLHICMKIENRKYFQFIEWPPRSQVVHEIGSYEICFFICCWHSWWNERWQVIAGVLSREGINRKDAKKEGQYTLTQARKIVKLLYCNDNELNVEKYKHETDLRVIPP